MSKPENVTPEQLRRTVEKEIRDHPKWCHPKCKHGDTFLPEAYREARLVHGYGAKIVQHDYDLCHISR
jgi:hypothetical protein